MWTRSLRNRGNSQGHYTEGMRFGLITLEIIEFIILNLIMTKTLKNTKLSSRRSNENYTHASSSSSDEEVKVPQKPFVLDSSIESIKMASEVEAQISVSDFNFESSFRETRVSESENDEMPMPYKQDNISENIVSQDIIGPKLS